MAKGDPIGDLEWFYRRGYSTPTKKYLNPDGTATSRVFKLREIDNGKLSVDVKSLTTPQAAIKDISKFYLFEISHTSVKECGVNGFHDPLPNDDYPEAEENTAHAIIVSPSFNLDDDITPGLLARRSKRVIF